MTDAIIIICFLALTFFFIKYVYSTGFAHGAKAAMIFMELKKRQEKKESKSEGTPNE